MSLTKDILEAYYPKHKCFIDQNNFYLSVYDDISKPNETQHYPQFIVFNGSYNCDKSFKEIIESEFYYEQVIKVFLSRKRT